MNLRRRASLGPLVAALIALPLAARPAAAAPPAASPEIAQAIGALAPYAPGERVAGALRLWGHGSFKRDFMGSLVNAWIAEFGRHQPGVRFDYRMYGTASAVGALYTGAGDIAILGEEISPAAARAFLRAKGYAHTAIAIATGSVDVNYHDYAHMIFVHRDNPLTALSLPQLAAIFGTGDRGGPAPIRHWDALGLGGTFAGRRIRPHGWKTDVDFALFFRERVLADSHRWNVDIAEYEHAQHADGRPYDHGQRIVDAVAADPFAIGISNVRYARPEVKALPLAWRDGGPAYAPVPANLIAQRYPLTRIIPAIVDRPPGQPLAPAVREFLRFLLSREGQAILVAESGYLPLGRAFVDAQQETLQ